MAKMFGLCKITLDITGQIWYNTNMTVYRIQSKQDRTCGAYHHRKVGTFIHRRPRPPANRDRGIERCPENNEYHGCQSAILLLYWFKQYIPDLLRAGYEIVALRNVTITAVGEYQVLFKWND